MRVKKKEKDEKTQKVEKVKIGKIYLDYLDKRNHEKFHADIIYVQVTKHENARRQ